MDTAFLENQYRTISRSCSQNVEATDERAKVRFVTLISWAETAAHSFSL
jgi:hypothetical protein